MFETIIGIPLLIFPIFVILFLAKNKQKKGVCWMLKRNHIFYWGYAFIFLWGVRQCRILKGDFDYYYSSFFGFFVVVFGLLFYKLFLTLISEDKKSDNDKFID